MNYQEMTEELKDVVINQPFLWELFIGISGIVLIFIISYWFIKGKRNYKNSKNYKKRRKGEKFFRNGSSRQDSSFVEHS